MVGNKLNEMKIYNVTFLVSDGVNIVTGKYYSHSRTECIKKLRLNLNILDDRK